MDFEHSDKVKQLIERLEAFMDEHIYPNQETYQHQLAEMVHHLQSHEKDIHELFSLQNLILLVQ